MKALEVVCGGLALALEDEGSTKAELEMSLNDVEYKLTFEKIGDSDDN